MSDQDLADVSRATGLAFALVGSLFERAKLLPPGEFSGHLAMLGRVTAETDPRVATILDGWADMAAQSKANVASPD